MLLGTWIKWEPIKNVSNSYIFEKIKATTDSLKFFLIDSDYEKKKLLITFKHSVIFYKVMDEIFASRPIETPLEYEGCEQFSTWMFFQVENCSHIKELNEEGKVDSTVQRLIHFSFYAEDTFVDVIATNKPFVEWI